VEVAAVQMFMARLVRGEVQFWGVAALVGMVARVLALLGEPMVVVVVVHIQAVHL